MDVTVVIVTHNRSDSLFATLECLAKSVTPARWEALVVDNASTDDTRAMVERQARTYPVPLRYVYEPALGKYGALNRGLRAAAGLYVAATDDDAFVAADWIDVAASALAASGVDFVGGPVRPAWSAAPPAWLRPENAAFQKVIAIQDHGDEPRRYGEGISWPLGVNVAYRRDVFDRVGLFDPSLGRKAGTLRNQAQREWHLRAKAAGATGLYVPQMVVHHRVTVDRLSPQYFRRWYYWHGRSRALLTARLGTSLEEPERGQATTGLAAAWRALRRAMRAAAAVGWHACRFRITDSIDEQLHLSFLAGVLRERLASIGRHHPAHLAQVGQVHGQRGQPAHRS